MNNRPRDIKRSEINPEGFWSRVKKTATCWLWTGYIQDGGYGKLYNGHSKRCHLAHRVSWILNVGKIKPGMELDHLCRTRSCVNPDHLEMVTTKENVLRGIGITAVNRRKTKCIKGHSFSGNNLYWRGTQRACRICRNAASRRYRARVKALTTPAAEGKP